MTREELIAEVTTDLKQYEESGLIDHRSLKQWFKSALKSFGSPIMVKAEKSLEVQNGSSDMPENFWSLTLAAKCDVNGYNMECGEKSNLSRSSRWTQRINNTYVWDNQSNQHIKEDYEEVILREYVDENTAINFRYNNFMPLTLVKGINKEYLGVNCKNRFFLDSPFQINIIKGNKLQTNFNSGFVYIQYNALPTDEAGNLYVPDVEPLKEYLQYHLKRRVLEGLWLNGDDDAVQNKIAYLTQKEREYKALATTQIKFEALGKNWAKKLQAKMRQDTNKIERLFPST